MTGLLPSKRRKQRDLLDALTAPASQQQQQPNGHMPRHASTPSQDLTDSVEVLLLPTHLLPVLRRLGFALTS